PSFGTVVSNSCPGVASSPSLGACHSASLCAVDNSSAVSRVKLRFHRPVISTIAAHAVTPASTRIRNRPLVCCWLAAAAASTRARKPAEGSAPCATIGSNSSISRACSRSASHSVLQATQIRKCSARTGSILPFVAASSSPSLHLSQGLFISFLPTTAFELHALASARFPPGLPTPRLLPLQPSRPPEIAAAHFAVSLAAHRFFGAGNRASAFAPPPVGRQTTSPSPSFAKPCLEPGAAVSRVGG